VELIATQGERQERVRVERQGNRYQVRVGDRDYEVEARSLGPFVRSLLVDGEHHEVAVFRSQTGRYRVGWSGRTVEVDVVDPLTHLAEEAHGAGGRHGRQAILAYMPGRVVSVAVAPGQVVEAGQALIVLEAMKMQNEIQADRAGTIATVHVAPGQNVEGGDPLLEIE
jgi:biotin carboxyl carrier protein